MSPAPSVLLISLPWDHPEVAKQVSDPTVIRDGIEAFGASSAKYFFAYFCLRRGYLEKSLKVCFSYSDQPKMQ